MTEYHLSTNQMFHILQSDFVSMLFTDNCFENNQRLHDKM